MKYVSAPTIKHMILPSKTAGASMVLKSLEAEAIFVVPITAKNVIKEDAELANEVPKMFGIIL